MLFAGRIILVSAAFVTLAAIIFNAIMIFVLRLLACVPPVARSHLLLLAAAAPWLMTLGVLTSSVADIWFDSCDMGQICLWNEEAPIVAFPRALIVMPLVVSVCVFAINAIWELIQSRRVLATLEAVSLPGDASNIRVVPTNSAVALAGNGRVFISRGLVEQLSADQYQAVISHEQAHLLRHDGIFQVMVGIMTSCYLPPIRKRLLAALTLANEEACDQHAAQATDAAITASAILAVERMTAGNVSRSVLPGFAESFVAARVHWLIDPIHQTYGVNVLRVIVPLLIILAFFGEDVLYYLGIRILFPSAP